MAIGARFVMLVIVSTAAIVAIAWMTFWAFNPAAQGRKSCALCRAKDAKACMARITEPGRSPDGACCCPQADANGCFTGTFACPPGFVCWADDSHSGTCRPPSGPDSKSWSQAQGCHSYVSPETCSSNESNDCCCIIDQSNPNQPNDTKCVAAPTPGAPDLACFTSSSVASYLDAVPMGLCQMKQPPPP